MAKEDLPSTAITSVRLPNDRKTLETIASGTQDNITIWEGGIWIPLLIIFLAVGILGEAYSSFHVGRVMTAFILLLISCGLIYLSFRIVTRRKIPFFTLTPEGLETSVFVTAVPWRAITDFQINAAKTNVYNIAVGMEFTIDDHFLPQQNAKSRSGSYYDEKTKKLMISGFNFRLDTNRDKLIEEISTYRKAAMARHKLQMKDYQ